VARALSVAKGGPVHEVIRVRTARREPLALERAYFPVETFPDLLEQPLTGSLYGLLRRHYGQVPHTAAEVLEPVIASDGDARLLGVDPGSPLMLIERTTSTASGLAVEYARDLFRPDRVRISVRTGIGGAVRAVSSAENH
jgi:GntR family transcriptional regulator